ncbi:MAG: hypothetical protein AAF518_28285 [Spirochaetota bacterium]
MKLLSKFSDFIDKISIRFWDRDEKRALLKLVYEIYNIDCEFSVEEKKNFDEYIQKFELEINEVIFMNLGDAISFLKKDEKKLIVAYEWIAEAIYKDGIFNDKEEKFVQKLQNEYGLSGERIQDHLNQAKQKLS